MNLAVLLSRAARAYPDKPALVQGDRILDYREFNRRTGRLAGALRDLGVGEGDRVAILQHNAPPFLETLFRPLPLGGRGRPPQRQAPSTRGALHPGAQPGHRRDPRRLFQPPDPASPQGNFRPSLDQHRQPRFHRLSRLRVPAGSGARAAGRCRPGGGRSGLALLHLRHHRQAQGSHALPPQPAGHDHELLRRSLCPRRKRRGAPCGPSLSRQRPLCASPGGPGRHQHPSRFGGLHPGSGV